MLRHTLCAALALTLAGCTNDDGPDLIVDPTTALECGQPATPIHVIQGDAAMSPKKGELVEVEAVVSARFLQGLGGIYLATPQGMDDQNPQTSEGLFVRLTEPPKDLPRFATVRVRGRVAEIGDAPDTQTALVEVSAMARCGNPQPFGPQAFSAVPSTLADFEAVEGMRIKLKGPATLIDNDRLLSDGELIVSLDGRDLVPTERHAPGPEARAIAEGNLATRLTLSDARETMDPDRIWFLREQPSADAPYRLDSALYGIDGVLDQLGEGYQLHLAEPIDRVDQAPRPTAAPLVDGDLSISAFNVLNFFNGDGKGEGFPTERGAETFDAFKRQRAKIVAALSAMHADVFVLTEIENDGEGPESAVQDLVDALNKKLGSEEGDYAFVKTGAERVGSDAIKVAMIYRQSRAQPVGKTLILDVPPFTGMGRAPVAQGFQAGAMAFTLIGNHFKSKGGCADAEGPNQDQDDGQGCYNAVRTEMARNLLDWLASDATQALPAARLIVGDLNSYGEEDPVRLIKSQGYVDVVAESNGEPAYSFVYAGAAGRLDHALANPEFAKLVGGAEIWHINADESDAFQYGEAGVDAKSRKRRFRDDPFASSDHDPVLIALRADDARSPAVTP
ncbi:nuclease [Ahniella affigens]|uniref:Nuclease n=1 Tax=Ahniella affigens TaxID=2021234 RepID=A0A2P1PLZ2_9GAMM|nr:ExeM/NucH family extracellular endonuclease [Ahniella affigens]AVP95847.1 nuclease [Ahniella affigens]